MNRKRVNEERDVSLLVTDKELAKRYRGNMEKELNITNLLMQLRNNTTSVDSVVDKLLSASTKVKKFHLPKI